MGAAAFADAVIDAGLTWIGPPPAAIRAMGDKTEARRRMQGAGVPVVPGAIDPVTSDAAARTLARELGYPVMVKAAMGGGGIMVRQEVLKTVGVLDEGFLMYYEDTDWCRRIRGHGRFLLLRHFWKFRHRFLSRFLFSCKPVNQLRAHRRGRDRAL